LKLKVSFFFSAVSLFLILNDRGYADSFDAAPPPVQFQNNIPTVPSSDVGFPFTLDLSEVQKAANASRIFTHGDLLIENRTDKSLQFGIDKTGDVTLNAEGSNLSALLRIHYKIQANVPGSGWVGCGWDIPNNGKLVFESNFSWNPDWSITSSMRGHLELDDPCDLTRLGLNVSETLAFHVKFYLLQVASNIDQEVHLETSQFLPEAQAIWSAIQAPTHLFSDVWLTLNPSRFQILKVGGEGLNEKAFFSLTVSPIVYLSRPHPPSVTLPSLEKAPVGTTDEGLNINLISKIKYSEAAGLLKNALLNKTFSIEGHEVTVTRLSLYPSNDKIVLKIDIHVLDSLSGKKAENSVYLWGTPTYIPQIPGDLMDSMTIPDLDFTSVTHSTLSQMWPWLFHGDFLLAVKPLMVFPLDRNFEEMSKTINSALNRDLISSVKISGDLQPLKILGVTETSDDFEVRGLITGFVNLSETADPGVVPASTP
jgi:hypothetical protein